jgi:hypothetical protein
MYISTDLNPSRTGNNLVILIFKPYEKPSIFSYASHRELLAWFKDAHWSWDQSCSSKTLLSDSVNEIQLHMCAHVHIHIHVGFLFCLTSPFFNIMHGGLIPVVLSYCSSIVNPINFFVY